MTDSDTEAKYGINYQIKPLDMGGNIANLIKNLSCAYPELYKEFRDQQVYMMTLQRLTFINKYKHQSFYKIFKSI